MLTVASLVADCGLELIAGGDSADRELRWVHISELDDPTPWLEGGEVLLTTGISLRTAAKQRQFVDLLADHDVAGMGFGTGFDHDQVPGAVVEAARERGLPLFEVPYEMPFIAITQRAATRLVSEEYDLLERSTKVHEGLERLVVEDRGLDELLASIATAVGGAALVHDSGGRELARQPPEADPGGDASAALASELAGRLDGSTPGAFFPAAGELANRSMSVPVPGGRGAAPVAWLTVLADRQPLGDFERLCARQAAIVVGLELMRQRIVRETERRLAGDLLADALGERLNADELAGRLRPFGIGAEAAMLVFDLDDPTAAEDAIEQALADAGVTSLVATSSAGDRPLLCAVIDADAGDPIELARVARAAIAASYGTVRAAASRPFRVGSLRRAFHEARCALEATAVADGDAPEVASHDDLGAFTLLLSLQDDDALRLYSDGLLDPIERTEGEYGGELLRSLEAFIENNGNWERAARQLYCHRHTLRYRIRKIEELTDRDLARATDRIELWLALRARELVR